VNSLPTPGALRPGVGRHTLAALCLIHTVWLQETFELLSSLSLRDPVIARRFSAAAMVRQAHHDIFFCHPEPVEGCFASISMTSLVFFKGLEPSSTRPSGDGTSFQHGRPVGKFPGFTPDVSGGRPTASGVLRGAGRRTDRNAARCRPPRPSRRRDRPGGVPGDRHRECPCRSGRVLPPGA